MVQSGDQIGTYVLITQLGRGGFGEVWLAERKTKFVTTNVAVKLPFAGQVDIDIIKQEAQIWARASGHPNILPIIEADEYDGQILIVSEYATDGSLDDLLKHNKGTLPFSKSLLILDGIVSGLEFLHSKGIIHRDLKPANILLQGDVPRVTDFGISRIMKTTAESMNVAGTPLYMAPEAFDRKRNAQTDIWSIGVIAYQLLTGRYPFEENNIADLMSAIVLKEPNSIPDSVPRPLQDIINKSIEKSTSKRYQSASELKSDLRAYLYRQDFEKSVPAKETLTGTTIRDSSMVESQDHKTVAILPFTNLTGNPESSFYEFSLADAVTTDLARLRSVTVRPSSAIARYRGQRIDPCAAGREMLVKAVLCASFLHSNTRIRVNAQLLNVSSGDIIWSDRIDVEASDIFAVQDTIAREIVKGLELNLSRNEKTALSKRPTEIPEAYEEYLRGRDKFAQYIFRSLSLEDCNDAIENFTNATKLDPNFSLAWSGLGTCYANKVFKGMGDMTDLNFAQFFLTRAIELDSSIVEARVVMCYVDLAQGRKRGALDRVEQIQDEFPNRPEPFFIKHLLHRVKGEYDKALSCLEGFGKLDPSSAVVVNYNSARIYAMKGDFVRAFEEIDAGAKLEPNHPGLKIFKAIVFFLSNRLDEALGVVKPVLEQNPHLEGIRALLALLFAADNQQDKSRETISDSVMKMAEADWDSAYWLACTYALLGEKENAYKWLTRSIDLGFEDRKWMENDRALVSLHDESRFQELMASAKRKNAESA